MMANYSLPRRPSQAKFTMDGVRFKRGRLSGFPPSDPKLLYLNDKPVEEVIRNVRERRLTPRSGPSVVNKSVTDHVDSTPSASRQRAPSKRTSRSLVPPPPKGL